MIRRWRNANAPHDCFKWMHKLWWLPELLAWMHSISNWCNYDSHIVLQIKLRKENAYFIQTWGHLATPNLRGELGLHGVGAAWGTEWAIASRHQEPRCQRSKVTEGHPIELETTQYLPCNLNAMNGVQFLSFTNRRRLRCALALQEPSALNGRLASAAWRDSKCVTKQA